MLDMELVKNAEKVLEKEIKKIVDKGEAITPTELENLKKSLCVLDMLNNYGSGMPMGDPENAYGYNGYSGAWNMNIRRVNDNPYAYGMHPGMNDTDSYGRSRSPVTGRYISHGQTSMGYSGHSIEDRMIASLETQMDTATSDYERQKIQEEINRIRMGTR